MTEIQQLLQDPKSPIEAKRLALLYRDIRPEELKLGLANKDLIPHVLKHKLASSEFLDSIITPDNPDLVLQILNHRPDFINTDRFCSIFSSHFDKVDTNPQSADVLRYLVNSDFFNQNKSNLIPALKGMLSSPLGISLGLSQQDPMQGSNEGLDVQLADSPSFSDELASFLANS